jgi:rod shape determining protein RodA
MALLAPEISRRPPRLAEKLFLIPWGLAALVTLASGVGFLMLYSAGNGHLRPWADRQAIHFAIAFLPMIAAGLCDLRRWFRIAYLAYGAALLLVLLVDLRGFGGMGAQRWISLGVIRLQPSELMSLALVLALARYFHSRREEEVGRLFPLVVPALLILLPVALVLKEPDLGTAATLLLTGTAMLFLAGVRPKVFAGAALAAGAGVPIAWHFLHAYQKERIVTFLHPNSDPLGAGYHILQSKIALGSGGLFGAGFLHGSQSHLSFLPERATDFIFTMLAEEFGFIGALALLGLYVLIVVYGLLIALRNRSRFGRLLGLGIVTNFFLYAFINMAMVMGLVPVVGIPLPLVSYGGTAMLAMMFGFGLLFSVGVHRDQRMNRLGKTQAG